MNLRTRTVSRDSEAAKAAARAKIALHHFSRFTAPPPVLSRLLDGLERRKIIVRQKRDVQ
jgi:hypothetical protein